MQDGEGLLRKLRLKSFSVDAVPVTNARFAAFVAETGYVTEAEHFGWGIVFRELLPDPETAPASDGRLLWWAMIDGAFWARPEGLGSDLSGRAGRPRSCMSRGSMLGAFAAWAGGRLPTEAEWEACRPRRGARAIRDILGAIASRMIPPSQPCNIWQGRFPDCKFQGRRLGSAPRPSVRSPRTAAGLFDMAGNVWEMDVRPVPHSLGGWLGAKLRNNEAMKANQKVMERRQFPVPHLLLLPLPHWPHGMAPRPTAERRTPGSACSTTSERPPGQWEPMLI